MTVFTFIVIFLLGGAALIALQAKRKGRFVQAGLVPPGKGSLQIRIAGIIHILFGLGILGFLIYEPASRMILPVALFAVVFYCAVGWRLCMLRQKNRLVPLVPAVLFLFFLIMNMTHVVEAVIAALNAYIIYVLIKGEFKG